MDIRIIPGIKGQQEMTVGKKDTATAFGSGLVEVFATPAMIAFMEMTALKSIEHLLPQTATTVGSEVNIKHLRATPVGRKVQCESTLIEVVGRKLVFELVVMDDEIPIGHGTHVRYVVDKKKFLAQL